MAHAEVELSVQVAYAPEARRVDCVTVAVPAGGSLELALRRSGLLERHGLSTEGLRCGVWGKLRPLDHPLREGDRIEVYRPLRVDPKEARRQRYRRQAPKPGRPTGSSL